MRTEHGKDHKKYEFGSKASIVVTKNSGIIVGAFHFSKNKYDGHTLAETLKQTTELVGQRPKVAICDRGFRGKSFVDETKVVIPKNPGKRATNYQKQKARKRFRRRAGIEPIIGHLKADFRLMRNYLNRYSPYQTVKIADVRRVSTVKWNSWLIQLELPFDMCLRLIQFR